MNKIECGGSEEVVEEERRRRAGRGFGKGGRKKREDGHRKGNCLYEDIYQREEDNRLTRQ